MGTTFTFNLTTPGTVTLTFERSLTGRKVHGRCVASDHANRKAAKCTRSVAVGTLSARGTTGRNTLVFRGTLNGARKLTPGAYTVSFAVAGAARGTRAVVLRYTVLR